MTQISESYCWPKTTLDELRLAAHSIVQILPARSTLLLQGPMGVGKTTLVRFITELSGGLCEASSPTFAIHQSYRTQRGVIEHFDLYRLQSEDEVETSGLWDVLSRPDDQWVFIEWPERIQTQWFRKPVWSFVLTASEIKLMHIR